ncbi:MAG: hypothetical protein AAF487_05435 [Bacteroidota bacterium]
MKNWKFLVGLAIAFTFAFTINQNEELEVNVNQAPEYKVITVVESIVPMGIGRSRMIENKTKLNIENFTTERFDGKKSDQGSVKRKDAKIDAFAESKMLNFYSGVGINFQNIASNDALITDKLNKMSADGWDLMHITSGVESDAGETDSKGIFITRYYFKK